MINGQIKGDGTSRLLKSYLPDTYDEFKTLMASGQLPVDVLFNPIGWSILPTFLNKDVLLKDATAALYGLGADAVPNDVLALIKTLIDSNYSELSSLANSKAKIATGSYVGTGAFNGSETNSALTYITVGFTPKFFLLTNNGQAIVAIGQNIGFCVLGNNVHGLDISHVSPSIVTWGPTIALSVTYSLGASGQFNDSGRTYYWIAIE